MPHHDVPVTPPHRPSVGPRLRRLRAIAWVVILTLIVAAVVVTALALLFG